MTLPFFYIANHDATQKEIVLDEDTSRHIVQVLRMKVGEEINLTDGKGNLLSCGIVEGHKKHCSVLIKGTRYRGQGTRSVVIAISLLKNTNRFEWFLEKATEIGIRGIIPLLCERTEKQKFRFERMQGICISAMLQSQQCWLPVLHEPVRFTNWIKEPFDGQKYIAHCANEEKIKLFTSPDMENSLICIGPEGDFTSSEIAGSLQYGFNPVSLGETRLRSETAGVAAAVILKISLPI